MGTDSARSRQDTEENQDAEHDESAETRSLFRAETDTAPDTDLWGIREPNSEGQGTDIRQQVTESGLTKTDSSHGRPGPDSPGPTTDREYERYYGLDITSPGEAGELERLEEANGLETVRRWAAEGMPVGAMGTPSKMQRFRQRRGTPIPWDAEERNQQSVRRSQRVVRDSTPAGETQLPDPVREVISSPGQSLDEPVRREMEAQMGESFTDVRIHTGPKAATAADAIDARAFTVGNHVAFNRGEYDPASSEGEHVIAHELAHVRQQTDGAVSMLPQAGAVQVDPDPKLEREAEQTANDVAEESRVVHRKGVEMHVQPTPNADVDAGQSPVEQSAGELLEVGLLQAKLAVSSPKDPAEREAEHVAERVVGMDEPTSEEASPPEIQRSAGGGSAGTLSPDHERQIRSSLGSGKPLPPSVRTFFEPRFGADLSDVRVHTGSQADEAARSINAEAFTLGSDIAFAEGNYEPDSSSGKELMAHELTHVVQQGGASRKVAHRLSAGPVDIDYDVTDIGDIFSVWVEDVPEEQIQEVGGSKRLVVEVDIEAEVSAELDFEREGGANAAAGVEASGEASGGANLRIERILGAETEVDQYIEDMRRIASGESPDALESGWDALREIGETIQDDAGALSEAIGDSDGVLEGARDASEEMLSQARQAIANIGQELRVLIGSAKHLRAGDVNELFLHATVAGELAGNASAGLSLGEAEASLGPSFDAEGSVDWHRIVRAEGLGGGKTALTIEFFKESESEGSLSLVEGTIELDDETIASFDIPVADAREMSSKRYMNMFILDHDPDMYDFSEVFWNIATIPSRDSLDEIKYQSPYGDLLVESEQEIAEVDELGWSPTLELDDADIELFHGTEISVEGERIIDEDGMEIGYIGTHEQGQGLSLEIEDEDGESREFSASSTEETAAEVDGDEDGISADTRRTEESEGVLTAIRSMEVSDFEDAIHELLDDGNVASAAEGLLHAHEVRVEGYDLDRDEIRTIVGRATRVEGSEWNSHAKFTSAENDWRKLGEELANPTVTESDYRDIPGDIDEETREEYETGLEWDSRAKAIAEYFSETGSSGMVPWENALMGARGEDTVGFRYASVEEIEDMLSEYQSLVADVEEFVQRMQAVARSGARISGDIDAGVLEHLKETGSDLISSIESTKDAIEADDGTDPGAKASMIQSLNHLQIEVESTSHLNSGNETTDADVRRAVANEIGTRSETLQTFQEIEAENIEQTEGRWWRMRLRGDGSLSRAIDTTRETLLLDSSERFYNDWADELALLWDAFESLDTVDNDDIHEQVRPHTPDFVALGRAMDEALPGGWEGDPRTGDKLELFEDYYTDEEYNQIVSQLEAIAGV